MSLSRTKTWIAGEVLSASDLNSEFNNILNNPLTLLSTGTANTKLFTNAGATAAEWAKGLKVGTFTRDTSTASGSQAVTGVGFKPSSVIFLGNVGGSAEQSIGFDDATSAYCLYNAKWFSSGNWAGLSASINLTVDGSNSAKAVVATFDTDGFTLTWTKTGAPTGTADLYYMAFR